MNNELAKLKELAQARDLLIANGQLPVARLLRHLADNEIDSDFFAVVSECESYGKEIDAELSITDFALRAACYVDALIERLEAAEAHIAEYGMSPGHAHQRQCESRVARNELGFGEDADDVAPADLREAIQELRKRAEAAEAQIKELTADLDKESEIRHRIHEELNAIKGEQQPVKQLNIAGEHWMDAIDPKYREFREERAAVRGHHIHPAPSMLPPVVDSWYNPASHIMSSLQFNGDETSFTVGANWMRQQVLDMGAKPLPVIETWPAPQRHDYPSERDYRGALSMLKECRDAVEAHGLEVKS